MTPRVHRWLGLTALAASALGACAKPQQDPFTEQVAARMRAAMPDTTVTVMEPRVLKLRYTDGTIATQRLDNLWLQCDNHPETCNSSTERLVRAAASRQGIASSALSRDRVFATIKDSAWLPRILRWTPQGWTLHE